MFSTALIEQVRSASDIVEVIGGYVPLKRNGASFTALCPFHREKTPSFHVNPQRQIFHCFGCHKGGDVFRFVQEYENLAFPETVRRLADRAHIVVETAADPKQTENRAHKELLREIHDQIAARWHAVLLNDAAGQAGRDYLQRRGVSAEAIKLFRLGFAPEAWDDTVNWAKAKKYDPKAVEASGLTLHKEGESQRCYDRFRGRLMFPIHDELGRVIGFSGRVIAGDEKAAKYVNSPETPIFSKGRVIYGLDRSKRALIEAGTAIVCEGQLDLIACFMAGVRNVVAPQGTALTSDHARILKRYVNEVVLCFDADNAGQKAAVRALDSLLEAGLSVRVLALPAPHDPDSFIREHGADAFRQLAANSQNFFDFYLGWLARQNDPNTDRGRVAIARSMAEALRKTGSPVIQDTYLQKTAHRLGVSVEALRAEYSKLRPTPGGARPAGRADAGTAAESDAAPKAPRPSPIELWLLRMFFSSDELPDDLASRLDPAWIQHPTVRALVERRLSATADHTWAGVAALLSQIEEDAVRSLLTEVLSDSRQIPDRDRQFRDLPVRLAIHDLERRIDGLRRELKAGMLSDSDRTAAERRSAELILQKKALEPRLKELRPLP